MYRCVFLEKRKRVVDFMEKYKLKKKILVYVSCSSYVNVVMSKGPIKKK